jgi:hypothetical protein
MTILVNASLHSVTLNALDTPSYPSGTIENVQFPFVPGFSASQRNVISHPGRLYCPPAKVEPSGAEILPYDHSTDVLLLFPGWARASAVDRPAQARSDMAEKCRIDLLSYSACRE